MSHLIRRAALALVLVGLPLAAARGDYRSRFEAGIKAMDQKDWAAAARAFQAAINEKPAEGGMVSIYGMRYSPYLPHYFLGVAYSNLGNCEAALTELKESERQGAVQKSDKFQELTRLRTQCEAVAGSGVKPTAVAVRPTAVAESVPPTAIPRPAAPSPTSPPKVARAEPSPTRPAAPQATAIPEAQIARARSDAQAQVQTAERAAADLTTQHGEGDALAVWQSDPALGRKEEGARKTLESARTLLADTRQRPDLALINRAGQTAADAIRQYAALSKSLTDRVALARAQKEKEEKFAAARELEARRSEAKTLLAQLPRTPANPAMRQARDELQASLTRLEGSPADRPAADLRSSAESIARLTASLRALGRPSPPPQELLAGAAAYFAGEYEKAAQILESKTFTDPRASAQARLLIAASRYCSWILGGSVDTKLHDQASADVRACVHLNSAVVLNQRAFSPRFVDFFQKERNAAQPSSKNGPGGSS